MFTTTLFKPKAASKSRLLIGVAAIALGLCTSVPALAATDDTEKPVIVGLGDSFTSGVGTTDIDPASGICRRSFDSYPLVAAESLGAVGQNAACSGATSSGLTDSFRGQLPQTQRIGNADAVVMTIGGNDVLTVANATSALIDQRLVEQKLEQLRPVLQSGFEATKAATKPNAPILVLAYPNLFPTTDPGTCPVGVGGLLPQIQQSFKSLNDVIAQQAKASGVTFVDTSEAFVGHDICSPNPWATGFTDMSVALHPNTEGHAQLGRIVAAELSKAFTPTEQVVPSTTVPAKSPASDETQVLGAPVATADDDSPHAGPHTSDSDNNSSTESTSTAQPQLAVTGLQTSILISTGFGFVGLGLALMWLSMRPTPAPAYVRIRRQR